MAITASLVGNIFITDNSAGSVSLQKAVNLAFVGTEAAYSNTTTITSGGTAITLPVSPLQFVFIKNPNTTATVAVAWTKTGGSTQAIVTLQPGSGIALIENNVTSGITALTLTSSAATSAVELVLAG